MKWLFICTTSARLSQILKRLYFEQLLLDFDKILKWCLFVLLLLDFVRFQIVLILLDWFIFKNTIITTSTAWHDKCLSNFSVEPFIGFEKLKKNLRRWTKAITRLSLKYFQQALFLLIFDRFSALTCTTNRLTDLRMNFHSRL